MATLNPFDPLAIGSRVRAVRVHHGINQSDFAASVEIDATSLGRIEKGLKPLKADMAYRISERWGVSMDFLYRGRLTELPPDLANKLMKNLTTDQP